jgi:hypothetical protein
MPSVIRATAQRRRRTFIRKTSSRAAEPANSTNFPLLSFPFTILQKNTYAIFFAKSTVGCETPTAKKALAGYSGRIAPRIGRKIRPFSRCASDRYFPLYAHCQKGYTRHEAGNILGRLC